MSLSENNADDDVHFSAGDVIIIKDVENAWALKPGDVISFTSFDEDSYMETITHMIYEVKKDDKGNVLVEADKAMSDEDILAQEFFVENVVGGK